MKRFSIVLLSLLVLGAFSGLAGAKTIKLGIVFDTGGLGDGSFNDAAYRGMVRAQKELGVEATYVESHSMDDYEPNVRMLAEQGYDLIFGIGFMLTDAIDRVAQEYPDTKFGIIDSVVDQPNVVSVLFKENEGSFLQGVIAGMMTKTDVVGFVGGMESPVITRFEVGFVEGVKAVNPDAEILIGYTGKFDDPGKGKELALAQIAKGADVIYHASGACGHGVIEAAKEKGVYAIGVDSDQSGEAPNHVISSMLKRVDVAVFDGAKMLVEGNFKPGVLNLGLAESGVDTAWSPGVNVPAEVKEKVADYAEKIISGEITVPATK
ncbi:MAG: BMP family ABC transporter substrate-binding protein [Firmicutes bacterium]|nr:BMP family ABC transporter substrate-binding protein [Bacillota bacterium]